MSTTMSVRFWGVRGSIPCPGPNTVRYGGNTSCVEVKCGDHRLVFDAGSGLRMLGLALADEPGPVDIDLFLSHCHIDHLIGLPFFVSAFVTGNRLRLWAGNLKAAGGVQETVRKLVSYPLFPIEIEAAQGKIEFNDFTPGDVLTPRPNINVMTTALNHPGGATGYRVEFGGRAMAYITDTELGADAIDPALLELARDASIVIIDTTYTDEELPEHVGWGHSSWQQAVRLANEAGVGKLYLFHHDPEHDDDEMDRIAAAAAKARSGTVVAKEGLSIEI
ncbi:MAG: MBL fold metallo-hydrolase [Afipia birgiae]|nr:MBL fold metallo-hydrolase [Afipia birgiae]